MCGICGIYEHGVNGESLSESIHRMENAIAHRGPDGNGEYFSEHIALGHRRLSIIDLEGGDQPIFNEDNSIAIVFNGEIYNYKELRADLEARHSFRTDSDTETIVHLYEEMGVECLQKLNGMFGFAIWDKGRSRLFIARDRLGEKPLYYHEVNGQLRFSSELKSLTATMTETPELNPVALEAYLTYGYVPGDMCILEGFHKLPPGHYLVAENGNITVASYWAPVFSSDIDTRPEAELLEELDSLYKESVNIRLRSDVPVGSFLSGGIDSSLTVAVASEESTSTLSTFSVGFSEADFDELSFAKQVAEQYGTKHHEMIINEVDEDLFPRIVKHFDEPFADSSAIPTYYVTREAARHVKVCLSGDAGDELFCGYTRYNYEPFEQAIDRIPVSFRKGIFSPISRLLPDAVPGKGRLRRMSVDRTEKWQRMTGVFDSLEREELYQPAYQHLIGENPCIYSPFFRDDSLNELSQRMWADQCTYLPDDILVKVDRTAMWHSLEVRVPFLDHRIVEFANRTPVEFKKRNGELKYPLKRLLKGRVPDELLTRPKKGFSLPIKHWLRGSMNEFSREMLCSADTRITRYIAPEALTKLIRNHDRGTRDLSKRIWTLLWLEQWCRENNI